jgi:phosphatidylglycerophosphate synthase
MEEKQTVAACPGFFTVANALTYSRLVLLAIAVIGLAHGQRWVAALAVLVTIVTDVLDGRIARRFGGTTEFGKTLDSTIDFVFIYGLFIALYASGNMMWNQFLVVYLGMLTILTLQLAGAATGEGEGVVRTRLGKLTGALQFVFLVWLAMLAPLLRNWDGAVPLETAIFLLLAIAVGFNSIECVQIMQKMMRKPTQEAATTTETT